jgi:hypothetical protein
MAHPSAANAELARGVALVLEIGGDGHELLVHPDRAPGMPTFSFSIVQPIPG